jgi:hypothetical protein
MAAWLSFLSALASAVPKVLEMLRDWKRSKTANEEKLTKDERNRKAIADAVKANPSGSNP